MYASKYEKQRCVCEYLVSVCLKIMLLFGFSDFQEIYFPVSMYVFSFRTHRLYMYPQSLHTHSPAQYNAALASSSAFWASVLRLPNTERDVVVVVAAAPPVMESDGDIMEVENGEGNPRD